MSNTIKILGFGGTLRKGSFTQSLLQEAALLCPPSAELEVFERLGEFPLFSSELENKVPEVIKEFKNKIKNADAVLIVTPEYNFSIPGYLKNALDWASRPYGDNSFDEKPGLIISASPGMLGGVKAQYAMRQTCVFLNIHLLNKPEIIIPSIHEKMKDGKLADEHTIQKITEGLHALVAFSNKLKG